jgi:hypothetical protein
MAKADAAQADPAEARPKVEADFDALLKAHAADKAD